MDPEPVPPQPEPVIPSLVPPTRKFNPILISAAVILLAAVGAGGVLLGKSLGDSKSAPKSSTCLAPTKTPLTPTPNPIASWNTHINEKSGYSIKYPSNFMPEEDKNYPSVWFGKQISVSISSSDVFECRGDCPINPESEVPAVINGILAYKGEGEQGHIGGNVPGPILVYQFPQNSQFFQFMYQHQAKGPAVDEREIFHQMATTFKFIGQASEGANWKTYIGENYYVVNGSSKFSVKYPPDWNVQGNILYPYKDDELSQIELEAPLRDRGGPINRKLVSKTFYFPVGEINLFWDDTSSGQLIGYIDLPVHGYFNFFEVRSIPASRNKEMKKIFIRMLSTFQFTSP